jgi:hypothetical protein
MESIVKRAKRHKGILVNCLYCDKQFKIKFHKIKDGKGKFCSVNCYSLSQRIPRECKECGIIFQEKNNPPLDFCSKECKMNGSFGDWIRKWAYKGKPSPFKGISKPEYSGDKHWNWQGGKTKMDKKLRNSLDYKIWREAVFARDNWTCTNCGDKSKADNYVYLEADHIKLWSLYPELRFAIDNGRTLCKDCHTQTDTYGHKARKYLQGAK